MESKRRGEKRELYDLAADPGETRDLLSQHRETEERLLKELTRIVTSGATRTDTGSKERHPAVERPGLDPLGPPSRSGP